MIEVNSLRRGADPDISFAIPLYNKREFFIGVINSICEACKSSAVSFEIVIVDNNSNDLERPVQDLLSGHNFIKNIRIYRLPKTINAGENWALALRLCTGRSIKLQLADDKLINFNLANLLAFLDKDPRLDYVIGKTMPTCDSKYVPPEDIKAYSAYYETVNASRKMLLDLPIQEHRVDFLIQNGFFGGNNILGDINTLIFKKEALSVVLASISMGYPANSWLDWEMLLSSSILLNGVFWDEYISEYSFNRSTNIVLSQKDCLARELQFSIPRTRAIFAILIDPAFKLNISSQLQSQVVKVLARNAFSEIQNSYPREFRDYCIWYIGKAVQRLPSKIQSWVAFYLRRLCEWIAFLSHALIINN